MVNNLELNQTQSYSASGLLQAVRKDIKSCYDHIQHSKVFLFLLNHTEDFDILTLPENKMFHVPEYFYDLSQKLSDVLNDIGVNETMVMKWRNAMLLQETMRTVSNIATDKMSIYYFGSLSEGTTTYGLHSDIDSIHCLPMDIVIQDFAVWQPGKINLLMVKDENTPPGYCQLQLLRADLPLPYVHVENKDWVKVRSDMVLLKNTFFKSKYIAEHGPSCVFIGEPGQRDEDFVPAFRCRSWPKEAKQWFHRDVNIWPTVEIMNFAEKSYCFVVPVGNKVSHNEVLEWRVSTSLAERSLMFSLNITQIRCYILMKIILKTYFNSHLSSFMCKTVLLYCIENTQPNLWKEFNLMKCLTYCLQRLCTSLIEENCPHFIIPGNNLMAQKFSVQVKIELHEKLCHIIESNGHALFGIQIDDLGRRLQVKLNILHHPVLCEITSLSISASLLLSVNLVSYQEQYFMLKKFSNCSPEFIEQSLHEQLQLYTTFYRNCNKLEQTASSLLVPPICSTLGTIKASLNLQTNNNVSSEALNWLHAGLNFDVCSGRLKLASVLYSMGDMVNTEDILRESERKYDFTAVQPVCHSFPCHWLKRQFEEEVYLKDLVYAPIEKTALCVSFTPAEINCIPHELQYEMFRSTKDDLLHRHMADFWMDWAVTDSLPYLYFLQYKTYSKLQRFADQQQALNNLMVSIATENIIYHRETALNLLGQCMEKENRIQDALQCYISSLHIRKRNNVARIHICKLLAYIVNRV